MPFSKGLAFQFGHQHLVHFAGIGFALSFLHHLSNEETEYLVFTATVLLDLA